jgi:hypothetical protein
MIDPNDARANESLAHALQAHRIAFHGSQPIVHHEASYEHELLMASLEVARQERIVHLLKSAGRYLGSAIGTAFVAMGASEIASGNQESLTTSIVMASIFFGGGAACAIVDYKPDTQSGPEVWIK